MFEVRLGSSVSVQARFITLWWDARAIPDQHDAISTTLISDLPDVSGIYAVTGRHDAQGGESVLYIGQATSLVGRIGTSMRETLTELHANDQRTFFSDIWNLTIRWARLDPNLLDSTERILIMSHSPPFNSQLVRRQGTRADEHDIVVMNAGRKGPLAPVAAGAYQSAGWRNLNGLMRP